MKLNVSLLLLLLFLSILSPGASAQEGELVFQNAFERQAFENFKEGKADALALLLAAGGQADEESYRLAKQELDAIVTILNPAKFHKYSPSKKVKKIFQAVQDRLLEKYQLENQFAEVFETGNFNCVSATAVYALLLERFELPYEIVEAPQHVYLVATPEGEPIVMESTDPQDGYLQLNEKVLNDQLQSLVAMKVITPEEVSSPKLGEILSELYPSQNIGLLQLVAIQYYNQSIYDFEDGKYDASGQNAAKANYLAPDTRYRAMMYSALLQELAERNYEEASYPQKLVTFSRMDSSEEHHILVMDEFRGLAYTCFIEQDRPEVVDRIYESLEQHLPEEGLGNDIRFCYSLLKADHLLKKGEMKAAWPYAVAAMDERPENLDAIGQFTTIAYHHVDMGYFPVALDSLRAFSRKYPVLLENKRWLSAYGNILIRHIYKELGISYSQDVGKEVEEFQQLIELHPDLSIAPKDIGAVYSRLALKQFNSSKTKALRTIETGLKYAPGNHDLLRIREMLR